VQCADNKLAQLVTVPPSSREKNSDHGTITRGKEGDEGGGGSRVTVLRESSGKTSLDGFP
jgi:hypothetical protein